jgi:hypothetical protein
LKIALVVCAVIIAFALLVVAVDRFILSPAPATATDRAK